MPTRNPEEFIDLCRAAKALKEACAPYGDYGAIMQVALTPFCRRHRLVGLGTVRNKEIPQATRALIAALDKAQERDATLNRLVSAVSEPKAGALEELKKAYAAEPYGLSDSDKDGMTSAQVRFYEAAHALTPLLLEAVELLKESTYGDTVYDIAQILLGKLK